MQTDVLQVAKTASEPQFKKENVPDNSISRKMEDARERHLSQAVKARTPAIRKLLNTSLQQKERRLNILQMRGYHVGELKKPLKTIIPAQVEKNSDYFIKPLDPSTSLQT